MRFIKFDGFLNSNLGPKKSPNAAEIYIYIYIYIYIKFQLLANAHRSVLIPN